MGWKIYFSVIGALLFFTLGAWFVTHRVQENGHWGENIAPKTYVVTSVQVIKEDVYLTIEHHTGTPNTESEGRELRPYKFPAAAFRYPLKKDGTTLTVVEGPGYKYMTLE